MDIKKYIGKLLRESILLFEGLSKILYHYTMPGNLLNITKQNQFNVSTNLGTPSDLKTTKGKFFFFSTTRTKGAYGGNVCFVLNGEKLNQKYKGSAIDYWQYSKNRKDYSDDDGFMNAMKTTEMEDRIILDGPTIDNALDYILSVHVLWDMKDKNVRYLTKDEILYILNEYKKRNIPIYFYYNHSDYKTLSTKNTVDPLSYTYSEQSVPQDKIKFGYDFGNLASILAYNDDDNFNKIVNIFKLNEESIEEFKKIMAKLKYDYFNDFDGLVHNITKKIHNIRRYHDEQSREFIKLIASEVKRYKAKSISEYIKYKIFNKPKEESPIVDKKGKLYSIDGHYVGWEKFAWNVFDVEEFYLSLPERFRNDLSTVKLINGSYPNPRVDTVYNFAMKNVNRKFADDLLKKHELVIKYQN